MTAVAAGLALRLAFGLIYWTGKPMTHDEREYLALGANVAAGRGFTSDLPGEPPHPLAERFGRAPLYPVFLALVTWNDESLRSGRLPAAVPASVKVAQSAAGALSVWFIALIARRVAGERAAAAASILAAIYPPLVWICAYAMSEAVYTAVAMATVLALGRVIDGPDTPTDAMRWTVLAGALAGLAILTRPAMLFFLPLAGAWLAWRHRVALAVALVVVAALAVTPWTLRNWRAYDRFVLVASEGGVTFWTGNHPLAAGEGDMAANPQLKRASQALKAAHPGASPEDLEPIYYREALDWIAREPGAWLRLMGRKMFYTLVPVGPSYRLHSPLYFWGSVVPYAILVPFALAGAWGLARRPVQPRALWLLAGSALLVCLVFFPQERFRIPVIDPALIVASAAWAALRRAPTAAPSAA